MMAQAYLLPGGLGERAAEIEGLVVIDERAGINAHLPAFLDDHFAEGAHEGSTGFFGLIARHAILGHGGHVALGIRHVEIRE